MKVVLVVTTSTISRVLVGKVVCTVLEVVGVVLGRPPPNLGLFYKVISLSNFDKKFHIFLQILKKKNNKKIHFGQEVWATLYLEESGPRSDGGSHTFLLNLGHNLHKNIDAECPECPVHYHVKPLYFAMAFLCTRLM